MLLPDSYGSRELGPQCRVKERRVLARRERVADIMASRQWLLQQPWAARDRISLIGWANGASAVAVGGASAIADAQDRAGFPLGDRVLSGLPDLVRPRMERAGSDAAADRRQGRHQFAVRLPPDGGRRARPQRAGADRGLSRRACTISTAPIFRCKRSAAKPIPALPERGHLGTDPEARADAQKRVAEWLAR